jgi:arginine/lysine/ornithine decarboxylase
MIESFYVVHLEDRKSERLKFKKIFNARIREAIITFFKDQYSYKTLNPDFKKSDFTPKINIELAQASTVEEFQSLLVKKPGCTTNVGSSVLFFVLDYFVVESKESVDKEVELPHCWIDGVRFNVWLKKYYPHIPVLQFTIGEPNVVTQISGWEYEPKTMLDNPNELPKIVMQYCESWWKPTFSKALEKYGQKTGSRSWHTPGHNAGSAFFHSQFQKGFYSSYGASIFQTDLSVSVEHLGDLSEPDFNSPLKTSQERSADIFGSEETFYITNGTSTSNKALLMALLKPGETVLLDRNCHKSVHQAVVMSGAHPIYLTPAFNKKLGVWVPLSITEIQKKIEAFYEKNKKPRILILTTCTYEGIIYPIEKIATMCERNGIIFYADEAWAPYLRFHPTYADNSSKDDVRYNALDGGAHFVAQSTHKALAAFSQASMIHISKKFRSLFDKGPNKEWSWLHERFNMGGKGYYYKFRHELLETLRYWHSTSPHYPMLATLDRSGIQMRVEGTRLLEERISWVGNFTKDVNAVVAGGCVLDKEHIVGNFDQKSFAQYMKDPLKLIIGFKNKEAGTRFKNILNQQHIQWEKSTVDCIEFLVTIGTQSRDLLNLWDVIRNNSNLLGRPDPENYNESDFDFKTASGQIKVLPRDAVNSIGELVSIDKCKGRICAQMLVPYPPGIPVFLPGLVISDQMIEIVKDAVSNGSEHDVHGLFKNREDSKLYLKVMKAEEVDKCKIKINEKQNQPQD